MNCNIHNLCYNKNKDRKKDFMEIIIRQNREVVLESHDGREEAK